MSMRSSGISRDWMGRGRERGTRPHQRGLAQSETAIAGLAVRDLFADAAVAERRGGELSALSP